MYTGILRRLRDAVRRKRPEKWRTTSWVFLLDNAPAHRWVLVKDFLAKNNVTTLEHVPYSLALATADFYLFPRLKPTLKIRRFCDATGILRMRRGSWKDFHKTAVFLKVLQSLAEVYSCTRRLFWRKCCLKDCTVLYFSEMRWFRECFEAYKLPRATCDIVKLHEGVHSYLFYSYFTK
jgi:hypothetical protein